MSTTLREALDRTLLLMRQELVNDITDDTLLSALTLTKVVLVADRHNLRGHSSQSAFVTAALLMARSGHEVFLVAPDLKLVGAQPPLNGERIVSALLEVGRAILPGIEFQVGHPHQPVDLEIRFGDTAAAVPAKRSITIHADRWLACLSERPLARWPRTAWPVGAVAAGSLTAGEAFKTAMRKLASYALNTESFAALFAPSADTRFKLAPIHTPTDARFGSFDLISAGAIINAAMYTLARIPEGSGTGRIFDFDHNELSNLNRNALLTRHGFELTKAEMLASAMPEGVTLKAVNARYDENSGLLAPRVLVGVDHIPSRWVVQRAKPGWLGIGATNQWSAMASFHTPELPCAGCLYPLDDPSRARIPTVAFVSFWAGVLLATYFLRSLSGAVIMPRSQQTYLTALRPELPWRSPVVRRDDCPVGHERLSTTTKQYST